jgi:transcriptional/translational regulatory protein YebC/TACO1
VIIIDSSKYNYEKIEELIFETNAEDIINDDNIIKIITNIDDLMDITNFFKDKDIEIEASELDYIPDNLIKITDFDKALKFIKMFEAFEYDEDVQMVSSNEDISDELINKVREFIKKNTFNT